MWALGISFFKRQATPTWDSGESNRAEVGVRTISAPSARSTSTWEHVRTQWNENAHSYAPLISGGFTPTPYLSLLSHLFHAHLLRHDNDAAITFDCCCQSKTDPWKHTWESHSLYHFLRSIIYTSLVSKRLNQTLLTVFAQSFFDFVWCQTSWSSSMPMHELN